MFKFEKYLVWQIVFTLTGLVLRFSRGKKQNIGPYGPELIWHFGAKNTQLSLSGKRHMKCK